MNCTFRKWGTESIFWVVGVKQEICKGIWNSSEENQWKFGDLGYMRLWNFRITRRKHWILRIQIFTDIFCGYGLLSTPTSYPVLSRIRHSGILKKWLYYILKETSNAKTKSNVLYFIKFCIKCNQICHKQWMIHGTIHDHDKSVAKFHIV